MYFDVLRRLHNASKIQYQYISNMNFNSIMRIDLSQNIPAKILKRWTYLYVFCYFSFQRTRLPWTKPLEPIVLRSISVAPRVSVSSAPGTLVVNVTPVS